MTSLPDGWVTLVEWGGGMWESTPPTFLMSLSIINSVSVL